MTEFGLSKIAAAKLDGSWTALDAVEALIIPVDLQEYLANNPVANQYFQQFNNSTKKNILAWIESSKRPETRLKRIQKTIVSSQENKSPLGGNFW